MAIRFIIQRLDRDDYETARVFDLKSSKEYPWVDFDEAVKQAEALNQLEGQKEDEA